MKPKILLVAVFIAAVPGLIAHSLGLDSPIPGLIGGIVTGIVCMFVIGKMSSGND